MAADSEIHPGPPTDSYFVTDVGTTVLVPSDTTEPYVWDLSMPITRCVGTVNDEGFLVYGAAAVKAGRLARTTRLTIRARISGLEMSGILGWDGAEVEVFLHRGESGRERSLGTLAGAFGFGWQDFTFDVSTLNPTSAKLVRKSAGGVDCVDGQAQVVG